MAFEDIEVSSRTQSAETLKKLLEDDGYTKDVTVEVQGETTGDKPAETAAETQPAGEAPPAEAAPAADQPAAEADAATADIDTDEAAAEAARVAEEAKQKRHLKGYKKKIQDRDETIAKKDRELEELRRQVLAKPADTPVAPKPAAAAAAPPEPAKPETKTAAAPKPKADDFENGVYDPAFVEALADWKYQENKRIDLETAQATKQREDSEREAKERTDAAARAAADADSHATWWNSRMEAAKQKHPDFDEVLEQVHPGAPITSPALTYALQELDIGPELIYHLGTHPEEAQRIAKLTQHKKDASLSEQRRLVAIAHRELAKIELPADPPDDDGEATEEVEAVAANPSDRKVPAETVATPVPPKVAAAGAAAAPAATPKKTVTAPPTPPKPVGNRGGAQVVDILAPDYPKEKLRLVTPDEFRKAWKAKYGTDY